jgi:hypothetical protein
MELAKFYLPDNGSKNSEFADTLHHFRLLPRPHHVVRRDRRLDHVHQDVGVPLDRVLDAFQKWPENINQWGVTHDKLFFSF